MLGTLCAWLVAAPVALKPVPIVTIDTPPNGGSDFGRAVAFDGQDLVIGGPAWIYDTPPYSPEGTYVFGPDGALKQPLPYVGDESFPVLFGSAVLRVQDRLVIGSPRETVLIKQQAGTVYTLTSDGMLWAPKSQLDAPVAEIGLRFGVSVAASGDQLLVGAPGTNADMNSVPDAGAVFVYTMTPDGWDLLQTLQMQAPVADAELGTTIAVDGDWMAASAPEGEYGGIVLFQRDPNTKQWNESGAIDAASLMADGCSGSPDPTGITAIALAGDRLILGDPLNSDTQSNGGAVYVHRRDGVDWTCTQKLTPTEPQTEGAFGSSVALAGNTLVVGARGHSDALVNRGALHVFSDSGGPFAPASVVLGDHASDGLGKMVATDGPRIVAQISGEDDDIFPRVVIYALRPSFGETCDVDMPCAEGSCESGVCCRTTCGGSCFACTPASDPEPGTCVFTEGAACDDGDNGCIDMICQEVSTTGTDGDGTSTSGGGTESTLTSDTGEQPGTSGPATTGNDPATASGTLGEFEPENLFEGCECRSRPPGGSSTALLAGALALLARRRRRTA